MATEGSVIIRSDTDTEQVILNDLDWTPACDIFVRPKEECGAEATWIMVTRKHCKTGTWSNFLCDEHYTYIINGAVGYCHAKGCGGEVVFRDYIVRLEPLKP